MGFDHFNLIYWVQTMLILVIAITLHECAHAVAADRLGDPTPRSQGRISLNPIDHLDVTGTILMAVSTAVGFGIGWGRPVLVNPANLKHPRRDGIIIAVCGPLANLLQACLFAAVIRIGIPQHWFGTNVGAIQMLLLGVLINLSLTFLNLIPVPPLDGSKVLFGLLPLPIADRYAMTMQQWGLFLFLALVFIRVGGTSLLGMMISPPTAWAMRVLLG